MLLQTGLLALLVSGTSLVSQSQQADSSHTWSESFHLTNYGKHYKPWNFICWAQDRFGYTVQNYEHLKIKN